MLQRVWKVGAFASASCSCPHMLVHAGMELRSFFCKSSSACTQDICCGIENVHLELLPDIGHSSVVVTKVCPQARLRLVGSQQRKGIVIGAPRCHAAMSEPMYACAHVQLGITGKPEAHHRASEQMPARKPIAVLPAQHTGGLLIAALLLGPALHGRPCGAQEAAKCGPKTPALPQKHAAATLGAATYAPLPGPQAPAAMNPDDGGICLDTAEEASTNMTKWVMPPAGQWLSSTCRCRSNKRVAATLSANGTHHE